jgi:SAM-dependent methyltransferase
MSGGNIMHGNSMNLMKKFSLCLNTNEEIKILDVGSFNVNGTYKDLFNNSKWSYTGLDIIPGKNVDIVVDKDYEWNNIECEAYDVIISGNCLEHVQAPWLMAKVIERVLRKTGVIFIVTPWNIGVHRYPLDCWRILPDGYEYLFTKHTNFIKLVCNIENSDSFFGGKKSIDKLTFLDEKKLIESFKK